MPDKPEGKESGAEPFYIKLPDMPLMGTAEATVMEKELLARLKSQGPRAETLKPLAIFYSRVVQQEKAYQYLKVWLKYAKNREEIAECLLMCGQLAEQMGQPEPAMGFYLEGLKQAAQERRINYYLHSNLAYCFNLQAQYEKAIRHCELAIALDGSRANAYKNLGISLEALGKYGEAAKVWIKAIHVDAADDRALSLLDKLMQERAATLEQSIPDISSQYEACRKAVQHAQLGRFADWSRGLTMN